ncbi:hypothetical protein M422DRAFT_265584 [Sphaerobolus stellatus SS14]|uniref:Uncharacterized protein n=1 Tax=Sphaerobolus stellatus (strain SS14) TaxID=990650 RepID=A0A0C9UTK2_SPHS4|nr:hypothetical protein M422DRAFT_265584 [Sphaerobolus stellatus SS14]
MPSTRNSKQKDATELPAPILSSDELTSTVPDSYESMSEKRCRSIIANERTTELRKRQDQAHQKKTKVPSRLVGTWMNPVVMACQARLAFLQAAANADNTANDAASIPPMSPPIAATPTVAPVAAPATVATPATIPSTATSQTAGPTIVLAATTNILTSTPVPTSALAAAIIPTDPTASHASTAPLSALPAAIQATDEMKAEGAGDMKLFSELPHGASVPGLEDDNAAEADPSAPHPACRPGALTKEQLRMLRDKHTELDAWVESRARDWRVTPITIYVNMGLDNREKRATSFWNKFQSVFWHHVHNPKEGEPLLLPKDFDDSDGIIPRPLLLQLQEKCSSEYTRLTKYSEEEITSEEKDILLAERKEICDTYDDLHDPNEVAYKEGNTQKLMRQARKEFTSRALYYSTRGVGVAGWVVSLDPIDATASASNFMFAGSDAARNWFDTHAINMRKTMRDFETSVRYMELQDAERHSAGLRHIYLAHCNSNDRRQKEISRFLKEKWSELMGRSAPHHLRWDEWPEDMLLAQSRTVGWPDYVPCPGRDAYKALEKAQNNTLLWKALCGQDGLEVKIEAWSPDEIAAVRKIPGNERENNETWLGICLVRGDSEQPLSTTSDVEDAEAAQDEVKDDAPVLKQSRKKTLTKPATSTKPATKAKVATARKPTLKVSTTKTSKKRESEAPAADDSKGVKKPRTAKYPKSSENVQDSDEDLKDADLGVLLGKTPDGLRPDRPLDPNFKPLEGRRQTDDDARAGPSMPQQSQPESRDTAGPSVPQHAESSRPSTRTSAADFAQVTENQQWMHAQAAATPVEYLHPQPSSPPIQHLHPPSPAVQRLHAQLAAPVVQQFQQQYSFPNVVSPQLQNIALVQTVPRPSSRLASRNTFTGVPMVQWPSGIHPRMQDAQGLAGFQGNQGYANVQGGNTVWSGQRGPSNNGAGGTMVNLEDFGLDVPTLQQLAAAAQARHANNGHYQGGTGQGGLGRIDEEGDPWNTFRQ